MSSHTQSDTQDERTDCHTITPAGFRIYDKTNLTASIPMGIRAGAGRATDENIQNINLL